MGIPPVDTSLDSQSRRQTAERQTWSMLSVLAVGTQEIQGRGNTRIKWEISPLLLHHFVALPLNSAAAPLPESGGCQTLNDMCLALASSKCIIFLMGSVAAALKFTAGECEMMASTAQPSTLPSAELHVQHELRWSGSSASLRLARSKRPRSRFNREEVDVATLGPASNREGNCDSRHQLT